MNLPEEMQVVDLLLAKIRMENRMTQQLQKLVEIFEAETGCTPFNIYVNTQQDSTVGSKRTRNFFFEVETSVKL